MENTETTREDRLLASLSEPSDWAPNSGRALSKLHARHTAHRAWKRRGLLATAGAATVAFVFLTIPLQTACAQCVRPLPKKEPVQPVAAVVNTPPPPVAPKPSVAPKLIPTSPVAINFKQSGSPTAPIACEVYTDYECPSCAELYNQTMPEFIEKYVKTGKVRLLHRDLPLPQHRYAQLAARYANAAGTEGFYDQAVRRIFQTQALWKQDGNIDAQLALVLAPGVMQKVRAHVQSPDPALHATVTADMAEALSDRISQTPTMVVVVNGKRTPIAGYVPFGTLKSWLDELAPK